MESRDFTYRISSILGGISPSLNFGERGSYQSAVAIDPDELDANTKRVNGLLNPTVHAKFSGSELTGFPLWQVGNNETTNVMVYCSDGKFHSYNSSLAMRTADEATTSLPISIGSSSGNGLAYYNNFYYPLKNTNMNRYGPMDGTPAMTSDWWTSLEVRDEVFAIFGTTNANSFQIGQLTGNERVAQSIQETADLKFDKVEVVMSENGNGNTNYTVEMEIQSDNSGSPSGSVLHQVSLNAGDLPTSDSVMTFDFGEVITLTANTKYWFVVKPTSYGDMGVNDLFTVKQAGAAYANGQAKKYNTGAWANVDGTEDMKIRLIHSSNPFQVLGNETYPTIGQVALPNHVAHVHVDNAMYICDYQGGAGLIHKVQTGALMNLKNEEDEFEVGDVITGDESGATATIAKVYNGFFFDDFGYLVLVGVYGTFVDDERITGIRGGEAEVDGTVSFGAADSGSAFGVLDLPNGFYPVDIESYGNDLAILANQSFDTGVNQGKAALFLWDTIASTYYRQVTMPFVIGTALENNKGALNVWGGDGKNGYVHGLYLGSDSLDALQYFDDGLPPLAGAVDADADRITWGSAQELPTEGGCAIAVGSKNPQLPKGYHNIARANSSGSAAQVTSLKYTVQVDNDSLRQLVLGWGTSSAKGLDKPSTSATQVNVFRDKPVIVGKRFKIGRVTIPLAGQVASGVTITAKIYVDGEATGTTIATINNTNYPSQRSVAVVAGVLGYESFFLELTWSGTTKLSVKVPIEIDVHVMGK